MAKSWLSLCAIAIGATAFNACALEPGEPLGVQDSESANPSTPQDSVVAETSEALTLPNTILTSQIQRPSIPRPFPMTWSELINFDQDQNGATIAAGSIVDGAYSNWGTDLTCIVCTSLHAFSAASPGSTPG